MKKTIIYLASAALLISFYSCSKDSSSSSTSAPSASGLAAGKSAISFNYSGAASGSFASTDLVSSATKNTTYGTISGMTVSGSSSEIMMFIQPFSQTGSISFKALASSAANAVSFSKGSKGWAAGAGDDFTIEITKNDGATVEATFSGTLTNDTDSTKITITNGKLAAKY